MQEVVTCSALSNSSWGRVPLQERDQVREAAESNLRILGACDLPVTVPHGPAICVRRLRTLLGYRSLSRDLTSPHDNTVYAASVWLLCRKL